MVVQARSSYDLFVDVTDGQNENANTELITLITYSRGHRVLPCALSYASDSGAARICQRGPKRGSEVTERGEGLGGGSPSDGRDIFENPGMKRHFLAHKKPLLGVVYVVA